MNGCMSDVLRSFFSYQVAFGSTTSEYSAVVHMRKSSVTSRSSLPSGASSRHLISSGLTSPISPRSFPCRPCFVPSMCRIMYSWPLPEEPSRFERQTNIARRSEEHPSELQSLMRSSYAVVCLTKHTKPNHSTHTQQINSSKHNTY